MRILQRYLIVDYLTIFGLALTVFTFVMSLGVVFKAMDYLASGLKAIIILKVFGFNLPYLLMFTIPMSALCAVLLMFTRLSMDGEITAMRASGMSIGQIIAPIIVISIILSFLCIYINSELAPKSHFARKQAIANVGIDDPVSLLEEGRFVREFKGMLIYVGKKDGNKVENVIMYELDSKGRTVQRVRSKTATIMKGEEEHTFNLMLDGGVWMDRPDKRDPLNPNKAEPFFAEDYLKIMDYSELLRGGRVRKKVKDMTFMQLVAAIRNVREAFPNIEDEDVERQRMSMVVEANKRLAMSISCFAFTLLGIPLGMRSRRKESSIGIGISLLLVFFFYFFIALAESLIGRPHLRPDLIVWMPVAISEVLGFYLIYRLN
ncbi:MAG: LptF/LptG family permease [Verrucomicrobiota bacterium]